MLDVVWGRRLLCCCALVAVSMRGAAERSSPTHKASSQEELVASLVDHGIVTLAADLDLSSPLVISSMTAAIIATEDRVLDGLHAIQLVILEKRARLDLVGLELTRGFASNDGAAIRVDRDSVLTMVECSLTSHRATHGAAVVVARGSALVATDCVFADNLAAHRGGAVYAHQHSSLTIVGGSFLRNGAHKGGAIYLHASTLRFERAVLAANEGRRSGGGLFVDHRSVVNATHTTFVNNRAWLGPSIFVTDNSVSETINCSGVDAYADGDVFSACLGTFDAPLECAHSAATDDSAVFGKRVIQTTPGSTFVTTRRS